MTTVRKNQFETLIDQMMIEEVSGLDQDIRETLEGLDTDKKRMAILSILDKDRDMFMKIKKMVDGNDVSKAEHIKNVVAMLRDYVKVGEVEKKTLGEVMTPNFLVNDMLSTLPVEVWSNPDLKWLDPCSGVGVFACVIVERLMEGLKDAIPSDEERYKHIVENMLYVGELQPKNMFLFLCAFDPRDEYDLNVYTGSFLVEDFDNHSKNVWGIDKFDIIVQNPPYNSGSDNKGSAHVLWDKFVLKSIDKILIENGYLVAVHPDGWRSVDGPYKIIQNIFKQKQLIYLEIHNTKDGLKNFGAETNYDFYCFKNSDSIGEMTIIKSEDGLIQNLDISNMEFIPNGMFLDFERLLAKSTEERVNLLANSSYHLQKDYVSQEKDNNFKYPVVYTTQKDGSIKLKWSSRDDKGHFGIPKVIWSNGRATTPIVDAGGEYGMTQWAYAIIDDIENLENIKRAMESEKFRKIMLFTEGAKGHRYNRKAISTFRKDFWKEFLD